MSAQCEVTARAAASLGAFERWLSLWVLLAIGAGIALGQAMPGPVQALGRQQLARVNIPVGLLIWAMVVPMLMKIDFGALRQLRRHARGMGVTLFFNGR